MTTYASGVSEEELRQLTALFRLLSDKTRLTIVLLLSQGERNVTSLCAELQLPQPTVSHHLGLLRTSNIVANRRSGKQVYYVLNRRESQKMPDLSWPLGMMAGRFNVTIADGAAWPHPAHQ